MIFDVYKKALSVLARRPIKLWGLSLLSGVFTALAGTLFGIIPGLSLAIGILLSVSMTMVFLHGYLGDEVHTVQLFECFRDWATIKRVLCGTGYTVLWVFLWALIPIVGPIFAVIRAYEYTLVPYILVMEPDVKITEAYKVSRERMDGYKSKLFWAKLLWPLAVILAILILGVFGQIPYVGILFNIVNVLVIIALLLFGKLFKGLIESAFYVEIEASYGRCPSFGTPGEPADCEPAPQAYAPVPQLETPVSVIYAPAPEEPAPAEEAAPAEEPVPAGETAAEETAEEPEAPAVKYCPKCGAMNAPDGRFCTGCGSRFDEA